jgi:hypothetical protein
MTVGEMRKALRGVPANWTLRPQWLAGKEPGDHEPGVCLHGVDVDAEMEQVLARVSLFYLDDEEDDE